MRKQKRGHYLLVDGYNIIHASDELKSLAEASLELSRDKLIHILQNYQGLRKYEIIVVFDAHLVKNSLGEILNCGNLTVIYTREAETADNYIERASREMAAEYDVTVATSDGLEQIIITGSGARIMSARELLADIKDAELFIKEKLEAIRPIKNNQLLDNLDGDVLETLEMMRRS